MFKLALLSAVLATSASALQMVTPASLVQCQPVLLSWNSGTPPYFPAVLPGEKPGADPLLRFPETNAESMTWVVNLPVGTPVSLQITDSTGQSQWASVLSVQKGASDTCLKDGPSVAPQGNTDTKETAAAPPAGSAPSSAAAAPAGSQAAGSQAAGTHASAATEAASKATAVVAPSGTAPAVTTPAAHTGAAGALRVGAGVVAAGVVAAMAF